METTNTGGNQPPTSQKWFLLSQVLMRALGIVATLISTVLMATDKQTISFFGIQMDAKYNYSSALKFYVAANSAASFLSILSLAVLVYYVALPKPSHCRNKFHIIFLLDLFVVVCLVTGSSAASTIAYLGKYGNSHAGWMAICDHFGKWCNKILASLLASYTAAFLFLILTVWTSWKATTASKTENESNLKKIENKVGNGVVSAV
ncbi:hypothetical protein ACHQM5_010433 [Ranunculus cassubicifolius]